MTIERVSADIMIIGSGGAAAIAAVAARRKGAGVLIVGKDALVGGATISSSGGFSVPCEAGDGPGEFYRDAMVGGGHINTPSLVRVLSERAGDVLADLEDCGALLDRKAPDQFRLLGQFEGHSHVRIFLDRREASEECHALAREVRRLGVEVREDVAVTRLLTRAGEVVGAYAVDVRSGRHLVLSARVIILATGGFGELYRTTTNPVTLTGDGHRLAYDVGVELIDMEMVQFIPLALPCPESRLGLTLGMCSIFGPKVKLLNCRGERYMARYDAERMEFATRDVVARANFREIHEGRGTPLGAIVVDTTENDQSLAHTYRTNLPDVYDRVAEVFGEDAANWKEPFQAAPSQHFCTGGVRIDESCRTSVPGLVAVGEVSGGVHGANRLAGNALTEIVVFGQIAGESAAEDAATRGLGEPDGEQIRAEESRLRALANRTLPDGLRPHEVRRRLKAVGESELGLIRRGDGLRRALREIARIRDEDLPRMVNASRTAVWNRELVEALEVENLTLVAEMVARAALLREESRGVHFREDFPQQREEWRRNVVIRRNGGGAMCVDSVEWRGER